MKFYVVEHPDGFSVQTREGGGGILLNVPHDNTRESAELACESANKAIEIYQLEVRTGRIAKHTSS